MTIETVFFNSYGRLRSGWRFLFFILLFIFLVFLFGSAAQSVLAKLPIGFVPGSLIFMVVSAGMSLLIAIVLGWLFGRFFEGLPFRALGVWFTKNWFKDLIIGLTLGGVTLVIGVLIAVGFGGLGFRFDTEYGTAAILTTLGVSFAVFAVAAAFEEALFRGYILQTFARAGLAWPAIVVTSLFFAAVHLGNPNANWISSTNTALAGIWFGIAYMKTRTLWLPLGMHFMWNWMQGSIFGIEVSGLKDILKAPVLQEIDRGPAWLTGADYGIEASISCTIALLISMIAIYFLPIIKPTDEMLALTSQEIPAKPLT